MKFACDVGRLLAAALVRANVMEDSAMSMPVDPWKSEERVIVKRPEPEYASMRYLIGEDVEEEDDGGGRMCCRM
ncbi:hypothetical protein RRF57_009931 [Xylaria bambusicola]|uniref:Uncharacterized protein n=1 Tax=Xylaria bambusicola TaxID=326684 RepID=A0AAN7Z879_9PEZI